MQKAGDAMKMPCQAEIGIWSRHRSSGRTTLKNSAIENGFTEYLQINPRPDIVSHETTR
jgi:hypothetical protein